MRKEELIKQVAESTGIAICEVRTVIEAALKETVDAVANGKTLYIRGFGTLSPKHYKRKVARNIHKKRDYCHSGALYSTFQTCQII